MRKIRNAFNTIQLLFLSVIAVIFSSCDVINNPVKDFFVDSKSAWGKYVLANSGRGKNFLFNDIDLQTSLVYYVSEDGDDDNTGDKTSPLKTIDKALQTLKAAFSADTDKTKGYVLLLSNIEITSEINFDSYNFAALDSQVDDIIIAGYDIRRSLDAASASPNCRIMKISSTKCNISLLNLTFMKGRLTSAADHGAGLWISSSDASGKTVLIDSCIFRENVSASSGAAIYLSTAYEVTLNDCEISDNTSSDGASAIKIESTGIYSGLILSNTLINDNITVGSAAASYDYGYVIDGDAFTKLAGGVVIKDNYVNNISSSGNHSKLCAININNINYSARISGANIIRNNTVLLDNDSELERNFVLRLESSGVTPLIMLSGNCQGSSIGVGINSTITEAVKFTAGYHASGTEVSPSSIFVSDCAYGIGYDSTGSEAAFTLASGNFENPLDYSFNFAVSPLVLSSGKAANITVIPAVSYNGADITDSVISDITWNLVLKCGTVIVASSTTNILAVSAAQALPDNYRLYVTATLNGIAYDDSVSIVCKDTLEDKISVSGASVSGTVADSGVFVTGRNLTIPAMFAGQHELTQKEYLEYCYYAHSGKIPVSPYLGDNYPACFVSWYDAIVYCNLRSIAEGLTPAYSLGGQTDPRLWDGIVAGTEANAGKYCGPLANTESWNNITFNTSANGWRMPVEAEWEYLARGGNLDSASQKIYAGSDTWEEVAWITSNSSNPQLVGQKAANSLGLYDMSGNVYEYVWDWYGGNISSSVVITGYDSPILHPTYNNYRRMVRGGAYNYGSGEAKISDRSVTNTPEMRWANCGVRIVRNQN